VGVVVFASGNSLNGPGYLHLYTIKPRWLYRLTHACMSVCFRAADVLFAGAVMNRIFQPYEAHIPYILQVRLNVLVLILIL